MAGRAKAVVAGGIGVIHTLAQRFGLVRMIDDSLHLLKKHLPYHESDHVLNIAFNLMAGHTRLEDLERLRHDEAYMDMLGAQRIPDPTTAGDFLRRFTPADIECLMDGVNELRRGFWHGRRETLGDKAILDVDGTVVPTLGEKKEGMAYSYNGVWGYHPLMVSLANTQEPLFLVNRPGNAASHEGSVRWIDKAIELTKPVFGKVLVRGDTDYSLTEHFDRWSDTDVHFIFGYDAKPNLEKIAESLPDEAWSPLVRPKKYHPLTEPRRQRENIKDQIVVEKEWETLRLKGEDIGEFPYRPNKCRKTYRMIVVRKNIGVTKGEKYLFDQIRFFFYITNDLDLRPEEVVWNANARCHQENLIEQLKNGVNALRVPVYDLTSNWAYMVIASLAWTLKAWFALTLPKAEDREWILAMEFKRFLHQVMLIPCQVIHAARRVYLRIMGYTEGVRLIFSALEVKFFNNTS